MGFESKDEYNEIMFLREITHISLQDQTLFYSYIVIYILIPKETSVVPIRIQTM